uniref:Uncharacterized protein n=2 Tax=Odontella aurita TaxID=265563 RepID=A0A7S4MQM3_9STRA
MVAPVRETAAQLLSLLLSAAPSNIRVKSLRVLGRLAKYQSEDGWTGWEVKHGAMLGLKYSGALLPLSLVEGIALKKEEGDVEGGSDMVALAAAGLVDASDDVRGAAASALSSLLRTSAADASDSNDSVSVRIVRSASSPLWSALLSATSVSSCSADLLALLGDLAKIDCAGVVRGVDGCGSSDNGSSEPLLRSFQLVGPGAVAGYGAPSSPPAIAAAGNKDEDEVLRDGRMAALEGVMTKLLEFLSPENSPPVRLSCLEVIGRVAEPSARLTISSVTVAASGGGTRFGRMAAAYCRLLERLLASHFEDGGFAGAEFNRSGGSPPKSDGADADDDVTREAEGRERRRVERYARARDEAWSKLIESLAVLLSSEERGANSSHFPGASTPCGRRVLNTAAALLMRLVGIEMNFEEGSSSASAGNDPPRRIHLSPMGLEGKLCVNFAAQHTAARSLAGFCDCVGLAPPALGDFVEALLRSPWPEVCEAGCILYGALARGSRREEQPCGSHRCENSLDSSHGDAYEVAAPGNRWAACRELVVSLLDSPPPCLAAVGSERNGAAAARSNPQIAAVCDLALAKLTRDCVFSSSRFPPRRGDHDDASFGATTPSGAFPASDIENLWRGVFQSVGVDWPPTASVEEPPGPGSIPPTVTSVRLAASAAGAVVSAWELPSKVTSLMRALMTSLRNETSGERAEFTSASVARLILLLSPPSPERGGDNETSSSARNEGRELRARNRLLESAVDLACAQVQGELSPVGSPEATSHLAARHLLSMVVSSNQDSMASLADMTPIWECMQPLVTNNGSSLSEPTSNIIALGRPLQLLAAIVSGLSAQSQPYIEVVDCILPNVTILACNGDADPDLQSDAQSTAMAICGIDPLRSMPTTLPILLGCLRDLDNCSRRRSACRLLHSLVRKLETHICPFVQCLLPVAMSMMTDLDEDCSRTAASAFAVLVRVAPLIGETDARVQLPEGLYDKSTDDVISHLIHGKPLPPCELPFKVRNALECSGVQLRKYQMEGVAWIHFLRSVNLNGALCDDMGLGKTLQALICIGIAHCQQEEGQTQPSKSLVVCPASVVGHWVSEIGKYFAKGCFQVLRYSGSSKQRKALWSAKSNLCNIVVTNYSILRNDVNILTEKAWNYCVLDEGHLLKNPKTATALAARQLKCCHRLILTGTPVQNKVHELWAAFDFLMPNFLGSLSAFTKEYARPIQNGQLPDASADKISLGMNKLRALHQQVLPFILRREKGQVMKELPPKILTDIPCSLSPEQHNLYKALCTQPEAKQAVKELEKKLNDCGESTGTDEESLGREVLKSLLLLRLLCTHPVLLAAKKQSYGETEGERVLFLNSHAKLDCSGKLRVLNDLLRSSGVYHEEITGADNDDSLLYIDNEGAESENDLMLNGESENVFSDEDDVATMPSASKCLIFAQFSQSLDVVEQLLFQPHMPSLRYLRLDGKVSPEDRTHVVEKFNSDESIRALLLTTRVGGLGLNLTGADTVIFLEHDWNPHVDIQAMDRAHRIGQTKTVNVYRLITSETIEEKIIKMQQMKLKMSNEIVNTDNSTMFSMGTERLLDLFAFEGGGEEIERNKTITSQNLDPIGDTWLEEEYSSLTVSNFLHELKGA